jgi:hypothetical protein
MSEKREALARAGQLCSVSCSKIGMSPGGRKCFIRLAAGSACLHVDNFTVRDGWVRTSTSLLSTKRTKGRSNQQRHSTEALNTRSPAAGLSQVPATLERASRRRPYDYAGEIGCGGCPLPPATTEGPRSVSGHHGLGRAGYVGYAGYATSGNFFMRARMKSCQNWRNRRNLT